MSSAALRFTIVLATLLCSQRIATAQSEERSIAERLEEIRQETSTPGIVAGIFTADHPKRVWTIGVRSTETDAPIRRDDHFRIASVSKLFVGQLGLQLMRERKLTCEDTLSQFFPDYPDADKITIAMLGAHTSGVPDPIRDDRFQQLILAKPDRDWSIDELIAFAKDLKPLGGPGEKWAYANMNTVLLAAVAEKVTGSPYRQLLARRVFQPWALRSTGFAPAELPAPAPRGYRHGKPSRWLGYGDQFVDVNFAGAGWTGPAGDIYSTIDDLATAVPRIVRMHRHMIDNGIALPLVSTGDGAHRYGFQMERRGDWWGHAGNVPGFSAAVWHHPQQNRTVVALTNLSNADDGSVPAETVAELLMQIGPTP